MMAPRIAARQDDTRPRVANSTRCAALQDGPDSAYTDERHTDTIKCCLTACSDGVMLKVCSSRDAGR